MSRSPRAATRSWTTASSGSPRSAFWFRTAGSRIAPAPWADSPAHDGLTLAREVDELLRERLPSVPEDDRMHDVLAVASLELAAALRGVGAAS